MDVLKRRDFLGTVAAGVGARSRARAAVSPNRPKIILILCDDLGWGDLGCYGSKLRTPNIDRMAAKGVRFEQYSSVSAVCSPARAALMTGRYPTRTGVAGVLDPEDRGGLPLDETTLAELLRGAGYRTSCVGKWHLGSRPDFLPTNRGFEEYLGIPYSSDMWPCALLRNTEVVEQPARLETLAQRYTNQATQFIRSHRDEPFFLYLAHHSPHIPLAVSERFRCRSPLGRYGDVLEELDWSVGEVLRAVKEEGLEQSTLVLFTSDNGPWYQGNAGNFRGRKGETFEGGFRVPFIAQMPGQIPQGWVSNAIATAMDIVPTVARVCSAPRPSKPVDGLDIWPVLTGEETDLEREALLYFDGWELQCARMGRWKLHLARYNTPPYTPNPPCGRTNLPLPKPELYDLISDPQESYDLSDDNAGIVSEIRSRVEALLPTFPGAVSVAWNNTLSRVVEWTPPGSLPVEKTKG